MYRRRLSITLSRILHSLEYKAQKIKGMPPTSKKRRQFKKRKKISTRALYLSAYGIVILFVKGQIKSRPEGQKNRRRLQARAKRVTVGGGFSDPRVEDFMKHFTIRFGFFPIFAV